jgi:hypothetical protein
MKFKDTEVIDTWVPMSRIIYGEEGGELLSTIEGTLTIWSEEYRDALDALTIYEEKRYDDDIETYFKTTSPILDSSGKKVGWGMYHHKVVGGSCDKHPAQHQYRGNRSWWVRKLLEVFKTKKECFDEMRKCTWVAPPGSHWQKPWYSDLPGYDTPQGVYISDGVYGH